MTDVSQLNGEIEATESATFTQLDSIALRK